MPAIAYEYPEINDPENLLKSLKPSAVEKSIRRHREKLEAFLVEQEIKKWEIIQQQRPSLKRLKPAVR